MPKRSRRADPKTAALLEEGTLNTSPERISDPKFQPGDFFDPRDLVQVRYEMLRRVAVDDVSVARATAEYGVSRPTFYQTKASFDASGIAGLVPRKRGPHGPRKLRGEILAFVEKQLTPGDPIRARELARLIQREFSIEIHPRTIERALEKKTLVRASSQVPQRVRKHLPKSSTRRAK
jgi:transposase